MRAKDFKPWLKQFNFCTKRKYFSTYGCRVVFGAKQNLRRPVVERDDLVGVHSNRDAKRARKTEIGQFDATVAVD